MPSVIKIPEELALELDRLAGAEHKPRAAYVVDVLWRDVRRNKQREALKLSTAAWNPMNDTRTPSGAKIVDGYHPHRYLCHLRSPQRAVWPHPIPGPTR